MSFWSKRARTLQTSKVQGTTIQSVQDIVAKVIHDVAAEKAQAPETLFSSCGNPSRDQPAITQPTHATTIEADDFSPNLRNTSRRQPPRPSSSQTLPAAPSHRLRASQRRSLQVQDTISQPIHGLATEGAQASETQLGSCVNDWTDEAAMTEGTPSTFTEANGARSNQKNSSGRQLLTTPTSQPLRADSPPELRASQRQSHWDQENVGEPAQQGLSQAQHSISPRWNDDIEFDEMEVVEMRDSEGKRGKKGGRILPRHVWSLKPGVRFVVPFNDLGQPVRKGGHVLLRFLGDVAKNGELCPIGEVNWHKVDKSCKADIVALVREKFVLPARDEIDKCILKHVGSKWRHYRYELKTQYKKPDKTEEVASIVPKGVFPEQWIKIVQYWFSDRSEYLSTKGREARASQSHQHTTGSKSFARIRDEFEKVHGREPGALELFIKTHRKKDGTYVRKSSKEFLDAAAAKIGKRASTSSLQRVAIEDQVFNELMYSDDERYRRPIGYGFGVTRDKIFGVGGELRKRGYLASRDSSEAGNVTRNKILGVGEPRRSGYIVSDTSEEVERLKFAMEAMSENNEVMQTQLQIQSQQLQMQSRQLQMQSQQMEGLQFQLQQVTSLLTKFGVLLNNPSKNPTPKGVPRGVNVANGQVREAFSELSDGDSESSDWESD